MKIGTIVVPTDFSESARHALDYAIRFAKPLDAEIVLVFVEGIFTYGVSGDLMGTAAAVRFFEEQRRLANRQLARLQSRIEKRGLRCRAIFTKGIPSQAIGETARRLGADLIVMSTHGRTGLSHLVMGSVAEKVVRSAPCPVLTVRGPRGS